MSIEFTGERVVPGQVDDDLWNEHFARYQFAMQFCRSRRVLDAGCGAGYGSHALAPVASSVTAIDQATEAVRFAAQQYPQSHVHWVSGSCEYLPFDRASFDVVVAFEVIEHLQDWAQLIAGARRVLTEEGVFLVSTPNKSFYSASRQQSGPNPFHEHEFELDEFREALLQEFPYVSMAFENHAACILFESEEAAEIRARLEGASAASDANFYLAVCSAKPIQPSSFVYVPKAANLLKERALHIQRLETELHTKDDWLERAQCEHAELVRLHALQTKELEANNTWARELGARCTTAENRIVALQDELETQQRSAQAQLTSMEEDFKKRTEWALDLERQLGESVSLLDRAEATVVERTNWALKLQSELEQAQSQLALARSSRWLKLGRMINVGPELDR